MSDGNGTTRTSEQDHVSVQWLERTVMDELSSMRGEIERLQRNVDAILHRQGGLSDSLLMLVDINKQMVTALKKIGPTFAEAFRSSVTPTPPPPTSTTTKRKLRRNVR
jgi:hypothetical protein